MEQKDKNVDIKKTFLDLIKEEEPEMSQEDAIKNYRDNDTISTIKNTKKDEDNDDNTEESEHLRRIKQELLASLERVKQLAKKIFSEEKVKDNLKGKEKTGKTGGKGLSKKVELGEKVAKKEESEKER